MIVESPAKSKTIEKFLGKNYSVAASMGHLRDLPKSQFGVDVENDYMPKYINIRGKGDLIKKLKTQAKNADKIFLATDPDREGEAIAWHLAHIFNIDTNEICRVEFNEITKNAIQQAIKQPKKIDLDKVNAQQTRRILDRIVGYKLSPLLWRKVKRGLSAGRVQSVAVKIICQREQEYLDFKPQEYWTFAVSLSKTEKSKEFTAELTKYKNKKINIDNQKAAEKIIADLKKMDKYLVETVEKKEKRRKPVAPFTTSSLQQDAVRKLGFTTKKTMMLAQQLYEGLAIGKSGHVGLITYMRTDSTRISTQAQAEAKDYILSNFGPEYAPAKANVYMGKSAAQDAHEAIRPSDVTKSPEVIENYLTKDQFKLYKLIWQRFLASQMTAAISDSTSLTIKAKDYTFKSNGSKLKFPGFLILDNKRDLDKDVILPELEAEELLKLREIPEPIQHFTEAPPRYNEATLVKELEELGIGRPSTYSPTIQTIIDRGYVRREEKKIIPTELGILVMDLLNTYFKDIVDVNFSAKLEENLDSIAEGKADLIEVLDEFYRPFAVELEYAEQEIGKIEIKPIVSDVPCEKCGKMLVVKQSRYGSFLACPGYPECKNTKPIINYIEATCPLCQERIGEFKTKKGRKFYKCTSKEGCEFMSWNKPSMEKCPDCNSYMTEKMDKARRTVLVCANEKCSKEIIK